MRRWRKRKGMGRRVRTPYVELRHSERSGRYPGGGGGEEGRMRHIGNSVGDHNERHQKKPRLAQEANRVGFGEGEKGGRRGCPVPTWLIVRRERVCWCAIHFQVPPPRVVVLHDRGFAVGAHGGLHHQPAVPHQEEVVALAAPVACPRTHDSCQHLSGLVRGGAQEEGVQVLLLQVEVACQGVARWQIHSRHQKMRQKGWQK